MRRTRWNLIKRQKMKLVAWTTNHDMVEVDRIAGTVAVMIGTAVDDEETTVDVSEVQVPRIWKYQKA
jgi:hypothetical protein